MIRPGTGDLRSRVVLAVQKPAKEPILSPSVTHIERNDGLESAQQAELTSMLLELDQKGLTFQGEVEGKKVELEPASVYKGLTGKLHVNALEIAFTQVVPKSQGEAPKAELEGKSELSFWVEKSRLLDSWLSAAPAEKKKDYHGVLLSVALDKPELSEVKDYLDELEDGPLRYRTSWLECDQLARTLLASDQVEKHPYAERILGLCEESPDGESALDGLSLIRRHLLKLAASPDATEDEFISETFAMSFANWKDRTVVAREFAPQFLSDKKLDQLERWLSAAPNDKKEEYLIHLQTMALEKPEFSTVRDFLEGLKNSSEDMSDRVMIPFKGIAKAVLSSQEAELGAYAQRVLNLCKQVDSEGEPVLTDSSQRRLLGLALDPNLTKEELFKNLFGHPRDQATLAREFGTELMPEKAKKFDSWLSSVSEEKRREYRGDLLAASLENPKLVTVDDHVKALDWSSDTLKKILASENVASGSHAGVALKLCREINSKGESLLDEPAKQGLLKSAFEDFESDLSFLESAVEQTAEPSKQAVASVIAQEFYKDKEGFDFVRTGLLTKTLSPTEVLQLATEAFSKNAILKRGILKNPQGESVLRELALRDAGQPTNFHRDLDFFERALEQTKESFKPTMTSLLTLELFSNLEGFDSVREGVLRGHYSAREAQAVLEALYGAKQQVSTPEEIYLEEDLLKVGDEILEVDL